MEVGFGEREREGDREIGREMGREGERGRVGKCYPVGSENEERKLKNSGDL